MSIWRPDSSLGRYGVAALAVGAAALVRIGLVSAGVDPGTTTFSPFYAAIVVAALSGGLRAGVMALGLSAAASLLLWTQGEPLTAPAASSFALFFIVSSLIVWMTHVTDEARLRAERAEHRVQTVLDGITDSFIAVDFGWRFTYVNEAAQTYLGSTERELVGRSCWDVFPQAIGTALEACCRDVMAGRQPAAIELPSALHPGRWMHLHASPTAEGMSIVFRDVTEERQLRESNLRYQERLYRALEAARMAAWEYVTRTDQVTYSPSASDVLGIPVDRLPRSRAEGSALIHPDDREAHIECVRRATRTADGQYQSRYRLADPFLFGRPGPVWIEDRGRLLFDAVGQLTMVQGVLQDVTAQKATEERIRALNQDLRERITERQALLETAERSSRAKDEFLAVLSHELRSPMQSVLGWVQTLRHTPLGAAEASHALDTIDRNLRQQTQLINDMLDVSRIVTGKLVFHLVTLPLATVVRETIDELRPQADAKGLMVFLALEDDLLVVADRERVRQVVSNLFTNAVKFTPPGGAVHVTCRVRDGMAQLDVRDTGEGIAAEALPAIFDRFRQSDTSPTRAHEGLGLGLSITRHIVDHLGGSIEAASAGTGLGARFSVRLPLAGARRTAHDAEPVQDAVGVAPAVRPSAGAGRLAGLDVMVVDDHRDTVELLAFVVGREGARVRTAHSAAEALAAWMERPADVLVTDLSMPAMDGFALFAAVGPDTGVPAIALSGLARADDRQRALRAGFAAHLAKPVEPALLIDTLERLTASTAGRAVR